MLFFPVIAPGSFLALPSASLSNKADALRMEGCGILHDTGTSSSTGSSGTWYTNLVGTTRYLPSKTKSTCSLAVLMWPRSVNSKYLSSAVLAVISLPPFHFQTATGARRDSPAPSIVPRIHSCRYSPTVPIFGDYRLESAKSENPSMKPSRSGLFCRHSHLNGQIDPNGMICLILALDTLQSSRMG